MCATQLPYVSRDVDVAGDNYIVRRKPYFENSVISSEGMDDDVRPLIGTTIIGMVHLREVSGDSLL